MWTRSARYLKLRRRDAICLATMCVCAVFSAISLLAVFYTTYFLVPVLRDRAEQTYVACTNALAGADAHMLLQLSRMQSYCDSLTNYLATIEYGITDGDDGGPVRAIDVVGTGRTKSQKHDYTYFDVRYSDGSVLRHYVQN